MLINEFDARIERVRRDLMEHRNIDVLLIYSDDLFRAGDVRYLTNFDAYANYGLVILPRAGELSLAVGFHHSAYLLRVKEVATAGYITTTKVPAKHCLELINELGMMSPRIGVVDSYGMFHSIRSDLERELSGATFHDLTADYERLRCKKSAAEMRCLQRSAHIADQTLGTIENYLQAGRTELKVVAEGGLAARRAGADVLTREIVCFLVASGDAMLRSLGPATSRTIREGDWFAVETCPSFEGYRAVTGRTYPIGGPGEKEQELHKQVSHVHQRICDLIKPGGRTSEIARKAEEILEKEGLLDYVVRSVGHGIGLDPEEPPGLDRDDLMTVEPGMALAVRTAVAQPEVGGAYFADTLLIGDDRAIRLSKLP